MEVGIEALTHLSCLLVATIVWHPMGTLGIVKAEHCEISGVLLVSLPGLPGESAEPL